MSKIVSLRTRRALVALDKLAAAHPERCQGIGHWDETTVRKIVMGTPGKERSRAFRSRMKDRGWKQTNVYLSPDAQDRLRELQQEPKELMLGEEGKMYNAN